MWKKIKEILCKHTAYKNESTTTSGAAITAASVIDLRLSPNISSQRTETVCHHHHHHQHQPCRQLGSHTLNKTDEHCRSLFNLLPTSLRSHHRQILNKKSIDASTTAQPSPTIDIIASDYDSDYMSQTFLNRTASYVSCYSSIPTNMPLPSSINRHGSIENLLHGHSKSNPANIRVIVRKNFEAFAQAHIAVIKGHLPLGIIMSKKAKKNRLYIKERQRAALNRFILFLLLMSFRGEHRETIQSLPALFSRGPWLYIRNDSTGKTGYIPRIICSLYQSQLLPNGLSISSTDSSFTKEDKLDANKMSLKANKYVHHSSKQAINRHLSHSSAIIDQPKKPRISNISFDERDRRNTYTLPISPRTNSSSAKNRRLTLNSVRSRLTSTKQESIHSTNEAIPTITRDTDSSSTQDSGYSESTPFFLVQQTTPDNGQSFSAYSILNSSKKSHAIPHYATVRRSTLLKVPDSIHPSQAHQKQNTLLHGRSMNDMMNSEPTKRHSCGIFDQQTNAKLSTTNSSRRLPEFALIRNVRRANCQSQQKTKPSMSNLPKSHVQIPASIFLTHHRQKQQFGSSHSAFRPVRPAHKHKRASSEGHSPSLSSSSSSSLSSSNSSINADPHLSKRRRLSFDMRVSMVSQSKFHSLTRSVCDHSSSSKLNDCSRTMSDILCDQFSEINIDAIEKDSLVHHHQPKKLSKSQHCLFTIIKDYRSSRASFAVKRGDCVYVLKQVGRACYLVRKPNNGQIGFLPKALLVPTTSTRIDTFLNMHEYRETII